MICVISFQRLEHPDKLALCGLDPSRLHRPDRLQDHNKVHLINILKVFIITIDFILENHWPWSHSLSTFCGVKLYTAFLAPVEWIY